MFESEESSYNTDMPEQLLWDMKRHIGFTAEDEAVLHGLAKDVAPHLPRILERFYGAVRGDPALLALFDGGEVQMGRHKLALQEWLRGLFERSDGEASGRERLQVDRGQVLAKLPQHYMIAAVEVARQELEGVLKDLIPDDATRVSEALRKRMMLDLGIMLESYRQSFAQSIRESERSAVEEKLTRAEHLAEIGQLAASLAHEIKNPLAGISGAIQIIGEEMGPDAPRQPIVAEILDQIRRLDAAVKDLLIYARPAPARPTTFDLRDVARRVLTVLREEPELLRVRVDCDGLAEGCEARGDGTQIEQLLMNLVINAAQASRDGDTVCIRTRLGEENVELEVEDTGVGMSPEMHKRAFEPFYTTKAKGTGLGLSICRKIAEAHHGVIEIASRLDEGTTVTVRLPRKLP
jgi:signal transduction histidine kinase